MSERRSSFASQQWAELLSEDAWQTLVMQFAKTHGWLVTHFRPAPDPRRGGVWRTTIDGDRGFFDLVLARDGVVLLIELKSESGRVSGEQKRWLAAAGGEVWRPSDWPSVQRRLARFDALPKLERRT